MDAARRHVDAKDANKGERKERKPIRFVGIQFPIITIGILGMYPRLENSDSITWKWETGGFPTSILGGHSKKPGDFRY